MVDGSSGEDEDGNLDDEDRRDLSGLDDRDEHAEGSDLHGPPEGTLAFPGHVELGRQSSVRAKYLQIDGQERRKRKLQTEKWRMARPRLAT